jgi:hypothetical protein
MPRKIFQLKKVCGSFNNAVSSLYYIIFNGRMTGEQKNWKGFRNGHDLIKGICLEQLRKSKKNLVMIASVPAEN